MEEKRAQVEAEIRQRRERIVTAADKQRDDALKKLAAGFKGVDKKRVKCLATITKNENSIAGLEERILNAEQTNDMCELVLIAKE
jgi:hypothetical protein